MKRAPPSEEELHAYLDGELPEGRRARVEAHLYTHPAVAEQFAAYRADGEAIARIFAAAGKLADASSSRVQMQPVAGRPLLTAAGASARAVRPKVATYEPWSDMERTPPSEEDLHAYLDGELPDDRRQVVETHLNRNPAEARRLAAYRANDEAIARIFAAAGELADASSPPVQIRRVMGGLPLTAAGASARAPITSSWRAAAIVLVLAGGLTAMLLGC